MICIISDKLFMLIFKTNTVTIKNSIIIIIITTTTIIITILNKKKKFKINNIINKIIITIKLIIIMESFTITIYKM